MQEKQTSNLKITNLIKRGVALSEEIKGLQQQLAEIKQELDTFFPAEKTFEVISIGDEFAERRVQNKWEVDSKIEEMKELTGEFFNKLVKTSIKYKPTHVLRRLVLSGDDELGNKLREYVYVDQRVNITFKKTEAIKGEQS